MKTNINLKKNLVKELEILLKTSILTGVVKISKVKSLDLKEIRKELRSKNIYVKLIKNTLIKKALNINENKELMTRISGQKILLFGNDVSLFVNTIQNINKKNNDFSVDAIYLYNRIYFDNNYLYLNNIGTKNDQIVKFVFILKFPIIKFLKTLKYLYIKLIIVFKLIELKIKGD